MKTRRLPVLAALAASALALAGCAGASGAGGADDGRVQVVASTNVYGSIVEAIGGDRVEVTSIIDSGAQDPHSFEPSARDQLAISRADLVVENGGGYDPFVDALVEASGSDSVSLTAAEFSHDWPENEGHTDDGDAADDHAEDADEHGHEHVEGFNEHVWYDPHTMGHLAEAIAEELTEIDPEGAETYAAGLAEFTDGIAGLEASLAELDTAHGGTEIFVTEPVPLYLTAAAGLVNVAPDAFTEAVEEGQDVPPATLLEALDLIADGHVGLVVVNAQTGGAETNRIVDAADADAIPVVEFTETLPEGQTYLSWMQANIDALRAALDR